MRRLARAIVEGVEVWINEETEDMREEESLCFRCALARDCPYIAELRDVETAGDIGVLVTRCREYRPSVKG